MRVAHPCLAKVPDIRTDWKGTRTSVALADQMVYILDMTTHGAIVRGVFFGNESAFHLNFECSIRGMGILTQCDYGIEIPLRGIDGPKVPLTRYRRLVTASLALLKSKVQVLWK